MKTIPLISVIIPIYNIEKYLRQCLESLIQQTYSNLEIILVDDGSPDGSPQICDCYAEKDTRIKVIHKKNGGVSSARNVALAEMTGEYVAFIDGDDWVDRDYFLKLYTLAIEKNADISECSSYHVFPNSQKSVKPPKTGITEMTHNEYLTETGLNGFLSSAVVWGKLFRRDIFDGITFPEDKTNGEDEATIYKAAYMAKKIVRTDESLYYYRQREDGASQNPNTIKHITDKTCALKEKVEFFASKKEQALCDFFRSKLCVYMIMVYGSVLKLPKDEIDIKKWYKEIKYEYSQIVSKNTIPLKHRLYITCYILFPFLFKK